ncbi:MAG: FAD-dependent monooxygenase [Pseudomonadales bacterium]
MNPGGEIASPASRVAVIGGGIVGAAAALLAQRSGAQVALFEVNPPTLDEPPLATPADLSSWPIRHVALAPASLALLETLGVAQNFAHGVFTRMQVWEEWGTACLRFDAAELSRGELGWMAELPSLLAALWRRVREVDSIVPVLAEPVTALSRNADQSWTLRYGEQETVVDLVLAADGARSFIRQALAVGVRQKDTGHHALATVVQTARPHQQVARQRFLLEGPLALLPSRAARVVSIVWSQSSDQAQRRLGLDDVSFCAELTEASEAVLGRIESVGQRAGFPIVQQLADAFVPAPGVALLGDAGHVLHPLAGLGVNLGLEDVAALESVLREPSRTNWAAWSRQRRARARLLQDALAALQRTYGSAGPGASLLRNTGIRLINGSTLLRRVLVREALGL